MPVRELFRGSGRTADVAGHSASRGDRARSSGPAGALWARLVGGAFWYLVGSTAGQIATAVASIGVARLLDATGFGRYGMVRGTIIMFAAFAGFGLNVTASKYVAEYRGVDPQRAGRILGLSLMAAVAAGLLVTLLVFGLAGPLASWALGAPELGHYLRVASPMLLLGAVYGVQTGALMGLEAFKQSSAWGAVSTAIGAGILVLGAWAGGVEGAVWGSLFALALTVAVYWRVLARQCAVHHVPLRFAGVWSERQVLSSFAVPSLLCGLLVMPVNWAANAMLVNQPGGFHELGIFNAANQWRLLILFAPAAVIQVALPMLSSLHAAGEADSYGRTLTLNIVLNFAVSLLCAMPIALASPWIIYLYGGDFQGRWLPVALLSGAAVLHSIPNVVGIVIASLGRMWWGFALNAVWAVELLLATKWLLPFGATGLAGAYLISYGLHAVQSFACLALVLRPETKLMSARAAPLPA